MLIGCKKSAYFELPLEQVLEIIFTFSTLNMFCEEDPMPELEADEPALPLGLLAELLLGLLAELPLGLELLALSPAPVPFASEPVIWT
ncbi:MAG TPA: hypothetical protein VFY05_12545 [Candidatus Angelobacter sp.]|nr:hypothetical protein [Candidatus Angelobacter sp.]